MSLDHTPLDVATLSPAVQKALGPGPARMMASRGLTPLPPGEMITVLYQLSLDGEHQIASSAKATATGLPDKVIAGALVDPHVDARVLDMFARLAGDRPAAFDALVQNPSVADETIAYLAGRAGSREVDRIAANEQRMLRHPEIISAMYLNTNARMSTVDRAVELAVRNNVRVPNLAAWDEIARALQSNVSQSQAEADALFNIAIDGTAGDDSAFTTGDAERVHEDYEERRARMEKELEDRMKKIPIETLSVPSKVRMATLGNAYARGILIRDPIKIVYMAAIKSPGVTEFEATNYAGNPQLSEDVLRYIAQKREWTKLYGTKYNLCRNPKTPITEAMRQLPFLREKDLTLISKSKGVPSAIVAQARKLLMQRRSGSDSKK